MEQPAPLTEPQTEQTHVSRWEDYIDVFFSPAELFARRARDRVTPPLLTLLGLAVVFYLVMMPANSMIMRVSMLENPEAAEAMGSIGTVLQLIGAVFVPITYVIIIAFTAALLWLAGRFAEIRIDFSRAMLIATYAAFVYLLAQLAGGVAVLIHGEAGLDVIRDTSFGVLRFVGDADMNKALMGLLRRLDIFAIWQAILWAIGIRTIYRVSTARAGLVAAVTWLVFAIPGMIAAALGFGGGSPS
jgi:hypothetical protein